MSYEITGNRHMGAHMKKKQAYLNEWKVKARRKIMPGYPVEKPFETRQEIDDYLNSDRLVCLLCGKTYKSLCGHLSVHGTNADDYKEKYGLPFGAGLTCITTKTMNVKHGKRLVAEGIFRPPTPEEHKEMMAKKVKSRPKPKYAIDEGTIRVTGRQIEKIFKDESYWEILKIAQKEIKHPTDVCKANRGTLPSTSMLHQFKRNNPEFNKKYHEVISSLPTRLQLGHGVAPRKYKMEIKKLREEGKTNAEVAKIMGIHEITVEKYNKKYNIKKPPRTTCGSGLHPYPGIRKPCQQCNTINSRKRLGTMDRSISRTILIDRKCSSCDTTIQVTRIYGPIKPAYCHPCKKEKYYASQNKYAKEKRPLIRKNKDLND